VPKVYRVKLTEEERKELRRLKRDPKTKPRTRERLEMIRLSDEGKTLPEIARIVEPSEQRVRKWVKAFLSARTFAVLDDRPRPGRASSLTAEIMGALRAEIEKADRTWSARQTAEWLEERYGLKRSDEQVRRKLKQEGIVWKRTSKSLWKRTSKSLRHKQKPDEVADRKADLETLEKGGRGLDRSLSPGRSRVCDDAAGELQLVSDPRAALCSV
jgi:transposase